MFFVDPRASATPWIRSNQGRGLIDSHGAPVLLVADAAWTLIVNLSPTDATTYCTTRQSQGFNGILVDVIATDGVGGRSDGSTLDGILPFTGLVDSTHYDLTLPNPAYFARVDQILAIAQASLLTVILCVFDNDSFLSTYQANGSANCRAWGQFLALRYRLRPNLLWLTGNDFQTWRATPSDVTLAQQVMLGIQDEGGAHLQAIELDYLISGTSESGVLSPLCTLGASYTYYPAYADILAEYTATIRPVILEETFYDGITSGVTVPTLADLQTLRHQAWWTVCAGGVGYIYGTSFYDFHTGWQSNLTLTSTTQVTIWATFVRSFIQWLTLVPDHAHTFVTAGYGVAVNGRFTGSVVGPPPYKTGDGNAQTDAYVTATLAPDGSLGWAYDPQGTTLTVDLTQMRGILTARWFDPTNGTYTAIGGSPFANTGTHDFATPGTNAAGDPDFLLVLTA